MLFKRRPLIHLILFFSLFLNACSTMFFPYSSQSHYEKDMCTVRFLVNDEVVQTKNVIKGEKTFFDGVVEDVITADGNIISKFRSWDKDINQIITSDIDFNAIMIDYARELSIDDFETYQGNECFEKNGWTIFELADGEWNKTTSATIHLSQNASQGVKSLRLDTELSGAEYKFFKAIDSEQHRMATNALKFSLMTPSLNTVRFNIYVEPSIFKDAFYSPYFCLDLDITSGEYVEYIIPFNDANWHFMGENDKTIASLSEVYGFHYDDINKFITKIEFCLKTPVIADGYPCATFLDDLKYVSVDKPLYSTKEDILPYKVYTGLTTKNNTRIKLNLENNGEGKVTLIDLFNFTYNGTYLIEGKKVIFKSKLDNETEGETLTYIGEFTNRGQIIKYVNATGLFGEEVINMDIYAVQTLDNFESYEEDGVAFCLKNKDNPEQRSGCRGAYYSEYQSGDTNDITNLGGLGWSLLKENGDELKMITDPASGNQFLSLENSSNVKTRYVQWGLYDGSSEKKSYRGSTLSFWAKANNCPIQNFNFYLYSQSHLTNETIESCCENGNFSISETLTSWKHFELAINPNVVYYGFGITMEENNTGMAYLLIDDVEIYSVSLYKN